MKEGDRQMVFDCYVTCHINGQDYKLGLPNRYLFAAERECSKGNLIKVMQDPPPSMGDIYILFKYALLGGGNNLNDEQIDELFNACMAEHNGFIGLTQIVFEVFAKAAPLAKKVQAQ